MTSTGRACIIGAGAAGLCAARHLLHSTSLEPVIYEQTEVVGGTWVYNEKVGTDKHGQPIHSSMYKNLMTNLPKEVMAFIDFPFPAHTRTGSSFLQHGEVRRYLESYCDNYRLRDLIRFEHSVSKVRPLSSADGIKTRWNVAVDNLVSKETFEESFDAVIVCNGHYSHPYYPQIPGLDSYNGQISHSHDYRTPDVFSGRKVAVLGAAASGVDISLEIAAVADKVFLSHNNPPLRSSLPENMLQVSGIKECKGGKAFLLHDGSTLEADVLLLCTGYYYTFPFLDAKCHVTVHERNVDPLYKHVLHAEYPNLVFIGIPLQIVPFPLFDYQMKYFCSIWKGASTLPSKEDMLQDVEASKERRFEAGIARRHYHKFGSYQWRYMEELASLAKEPKPSHLLETLYNIVHDERSTNLRNYKMVAYALVNGEYKVQSRNEK